MSKHFYIPDKLYSPMGNLHAFKFQKQDSNHLTVLQHQGILIHRLFCLPVEKCNLKSKFIGFKVDLTNKQPIVSEEQQYKKFLYEDAVQLFEMITPQKNLYLVNYDNPIVKVGDYPVQKHLYLHYPVAYVHFPLPGQTKHDAQIPLEQFIGLRGNLVVRYYSETKYIFAIDLVGLKQKGFTFNVPK